MKQIKQLIVRADQSPLNKMQWLITFACGHKVWHTQTMKPSGSKTCALCRSKDIISRLPATRPTPDAGERGKKEIWRLL